jgi:hypothetical protein
VIKVSTFLHQNAFGYTAIPLFGAADREFEKNASAHLLTPVAQYIASLRPMNSAQYVLVNALGAGEYFGSNINGDNFPEAGLIHCPAGWTGTPGVDRALAADWPYGFPTFYNAYPFAHHKNKDASRAYGVVELAAWNDHMKRVELVVRVDYDKCLQYGGVPVWDKLKAGQYADVSMGSRVPFDTSSITLDWNAYNDAKATYDPKKHRSPGQAVLEVHKKTPIKGLSITRDDYDEYCLKYMNRILPDGRKVFVWNDYPRFFDISFVFIGADRTAKVMVYIAREGSFPEAMQTKTASVAEGFSGFLEKTASVKGAGLKRAEIDKEVTPIPDAAKAIPLLTKNEPPLPHDLLNALSAVPTASALSTTSGLGMVLRPQEFQRMVLVRAGQGSLADSLDRQNKVFPSGEPPSSCGLSPELFLPALARLLLPLFDQRTALAPAVERRVVILSSGSADPVSAPTSDTSELLRKIGAAYNGYREQLLEIAPYSQSLIQKVATARNHDLTKLAECSPEDVFTPLSFCYLRDAYLHTCRAG